MSMSMDTREYLERMDRLSEAIMETQIRILVEE